MLISLLGGYQKENNLHVFPHVDVYRNLTCKFRIHLSIKFECLLNLFEYGGIAMHHYFSCSSFSPVKVQAIMLINANILSPDQ